MRGFGWFHGRIEAELEASVSVVQSEQGSVFGEYREEEVEFEAGILRSVI